MLLRLTNIPLGMCFLWLLLSANAGAEPGHAAGNFQAAMRGATALEEAGGVIMVKDLGGGTSQVLKWEPRLTVVAAAENAAGLAWKVPKKMSVVRLGERMSVPVQEILEKKTADWRLLPDDIVEVEP